MGTAARGQAHALFAQTMGYDAATAGMFALGAWRSSPKRSGDGPHGSRDGGRAGSRPEGLAQAVIKADGY
jgi:hypothetical protein